MGKCWIFEETPEVRLPKNGEWVVYGNKPFMNSALNFDLPILKKTEFSSNPLAPILEVWGKHEKIFLSLIADPGPGGIIIDTIIAICKCVEIIEGGKG